MSQALKCQQTVIIRTAALIKSSNRNTSDL